MSYQLKYRTLAEALYDALTEDSFYISMEATIAKQHNPKESMLKYLDYSICEAEDYGEVFIPDDHSGVAIWSKPISVAQTKNKEQQRKDFLESELGVGCLETYLAIVDFMSQKSEQIIPNDDWYLSIVGLAPEFQNQGLGAGLIEPMFKHTDSLGVATYLETFTPRNMSFYQKIGFQEIASFFEPTCQSEYFIMQRPADNV